MRLTPIQVGLRSIRYGLWDLPTGFLRAYAYGHIVQWRQSWGRLWRQDWYQGAQFILGLLNIVMGCCLALSTWRATDPSPIARMLDVTPPLLVFGVHICLHQIYGAIMFVASAGAIVAIMEWPDVQEQADEIGTLISGRVLRLWCWRMSGIVSGAMFWFSSAMLGFAEHPHWPTGPFNLALFAGHFALWIKSEAASAVESVLARRLWRAKQQSSVGMVRHMP